MTNIKKVLNPLILNELYDEFKDACKELHETKKKNRNKRLLLLLARIRKIKFFDPACGSGNFLITAYKEMRLLEMRILNELNEMPSSEIKLSNFYGIELDDFAHEVTKLSLWLTEHQMNLKFYDVFHTKLATLPLHECGNIVSGNACRLDWKKVCPTTNNDECYILGNPPYAGLSSQTKEQKDDVKFNLSHYPNHLSLDYIFNWFHLAGNFIFNTPFRCAFVSTNSVIQGEQVGFFWPYLFSKEIEICFAYNSFKWKNNAKNNAGVTCTIIGLTNKKVENKYIYSEHNRLIVKNINPYLCDYKNVIVKHSSKTLNAFPPMLYGNKASDGGGLIFTKDEKDKLILESSASSKFIKTYWGAREFINGCPRYCLWITDNNVDEALKIATIRDRVSIVKNFRLKSEAASTNEKAAYPHKFGQRCFQDSPCIIVPRVTSENRFYIPMGYLPKGSVVSDAAFVIYDAEEWLLGIMMSRMHMVWMRTVCGRLKTDYRYSADLCYNTFPCPKLSSQNKEKLTLLVRSVLSIRESYLGKTMAFLYDKKTMPDDLKKAHHVLDEYVDSLYSNKKFEYDFDRLKVLFKMYEEELKNVSTN